MSRRSSQQNQTAPTLFPFLAVLICTMGAIIVLLVLVVKRADIQANESEQTASAEEIAEQKQALTDKLEFSKNNIGLLNGVRPQLKDRLESEKSLFGHLTSHITELSNELKQLRDQFQAMAANDSSDADESELKQQLLQLTRRIEEKKKQLAKKRDIEKNQKQTFAIIPHTNGGNGTFRRPIFVECTGDGVTIQPYGITLRANDFPNPLSAGNPLDTALVMIRDYWNQIDPNHKDGQPYPLFVVRPSGSKSFAAGRKAMKSWVDEFGYELVTGEVEITYPKADEAFQNQLVSAVNLARQRQLATIEAINRNQAMQQARLLGNGSSTQSGSAGGGGYRASSITGGFVREPGGGNSNGMSGRSSLASSQRSANRSGSSGSSNNSPSFNAPSNNSNNSSNSGATDSASASQFGSGSSGSNANKPFQPSDRNSSFQANRSSKFGGPQNGSSNQNNSGQSSSGQSNSGQSGTGGNSSSGSGQAGGQELPQESMARTRGNNWALPSKANNSIQIRKPIKIQVNENEIRIVELGKGIKSIPLTSGSETAVPVLVEQVWKHIDAWGIAGVNSFWKPVLNVYVAPNADGRFRELESLLSGSGLDLRRVQ